MQLSFTKLFVCVQFTVYVYRSFFSSKSDSTQIPNQADFGVQNMLSLHSDRQIVTCKLLFCSQLFTVSLSPPYRPLCVVGRLGRKKKRAHALYFFRLLLFLYGYPVGASAEGKDGKLYYLFLLAKRPRKVDEY